MIGVLKKIWDFAGEEQGNIRKSMILGFFYAVFHMFQIAAIYVVVLALVGGSTDSAPAWQALGLLLASILGRAVLNRFSQLQQTHAGYFMVADKRISIGDKLKRVPMGYFNDQSLGELTGITTTVLDEVESTGPMVLVSILCCSSPCCRPSRWAVSGRRGAVSSQTLLSRHSDHRRIVCTENRRRMIELNSFFLTSFLHGIA